MVFATDLYLFLIGASLVLLIGTLLAVFLLRRKSSQHGEVSFEYNSTGSPKRAVEWDDPSDPDDDPAEDQSLKDRIISWATPYQKR